MSFHTSDNIGDINPFRYRGYFYDTETGYYYLNSRYYNPEIKRFISADHINYLGANGDLNSYNLYAYCSNNPVMYVDSLGASSDKFWDENFGYGLIVGLQNKYDSLDLYYGEIEWGTFYSVEVGNFDKPICYYWESENGKFVSGIQLNINDSPYGVGIVSNNAQTKLAISVKNAEGSIVLKEDKVGVQISNGKENTEGNITGTYGQVNMGLVVRDTTIATVVVIGTVQLVKWSAGAVAFIIISPFP